MAIEINIWTVVLIAFFTGLGSGVGNPIGQHLYKKFIEHRIERASENLSSGIKRTINGKPPIINSESVVNKILEK